MPFTEYVVHHIDTDQNNNSVKNLYICTKEQHNLIHQEQKNKRKKFANASEIDSFLNNIIPKEQTTLQNDYHNNKTVLYTNLDEIEKVEKASIIKEEKAYRVEDKYPYGYTEYEEYPKNVEVLEANPKLNEFKSQYKDYKKKNKVIRQALRQGKKLSLDVNTEKYSFKHNNRKNLIIAISVIVLIFVIFVSNYLPQYIKNSRYENKCLEVCKNGLNKEDSGDFYGKGYVYNLDNINERLTCLCNGNNGGFAYNIPLSNKTKK